MVSRGQYGQDGPYWGIGSYLQKNRWYCVEMYLKLNSIDTSGATLAHFGNAVHIGVTQDTGYLYPSASSTPISPDTAIVSAPHVYYGNKTGYLYPSPSWSGPWIVSEAGTDTAVLTSPGVGRHDAEAKVWIDGRLVYHQQSFLMRHLANVQMWSIWVDVFAGGPNADVVDGTFYLAHPVISKSYVGPMRFS